MGCSTPLKEDFPVLGISTWTQLEIILILISKAQFFS